MKKRLVVPIVGVLMLGFATPASGSVIVGQLAPGSSPDTNCSGPRDFVMPIVSSGNPYVVPGNGMITSWSHNAAAPDGQTLGFKVFRHLGGAEFTAVAHNGPRSLAAGTLNTFPVNIPVSAGDIIGLNSGASAMPTRACEFVGPDQYFYYSGDLSDGQSAGFSQSLLGYRLNISAVFEPLNSFTLGRVTRNRKQGTATLRVQNLPNTGDLVLSGKGVKPARAAGAGAVVAKTVTAPGDVTLKIRAKGKKLRKLKKNGKVRVRPKITFTPTGGASNTQSRKLKLKKTLKEP